MSKKRRAVSEINVVPYIDVMLVLLIIFMITAPIVQQGVEVELPNGLLSFYDIEIPFSQNMQGNAEILTDKKRLLTRVLNPIRSAISKQVEM